MFVMFKSYVKKYTKIRWLVAVLRVSSLVVFSIATASLVGIWVQHLHGMSQWFKEDVGMAFNTAVSFMFVAISLSGIAGYIHDQSHPTGRHRSIGRVSSMRSANSAGQRRSY